MKKAYTGKTITDSFGTVTIPNGALFGKTTARWIEKFGVGDPLPFAFITALALVKKACAYANRDLGGITAKEAAAIATVCDEIIAGKHREHFPVSFLQSGSGTITNMNMNEVIANVSKVPLHPNDIVNKSQSTNDIFPTAMYVAAVITIQKNVIPQATALEKELKRKGKAYWQLIKAGRTHLMDAVPIRLGMEFDAWGERIREAKESLVQSTTHLAVLPVGGTALGSGINAPKGFAPKAAKYIAEFTKYPFKPAANKAVAISAHDALVSASAGLNNLALSLISIATTIRWMASGPRTGLGELELPGAEAGSSIMPGKVNPSVLEGVQMACYKVMGNHHAITLANLHSSDLDMNTGKPVMAELFLQSADLLCDALRLLNEKCVKGIKPNKQNLQKHLENTLMTVTALTPHIGYDKATKIAVKAKDEGLSLKAAALALGLSEKDFNTFVKPEKMV